MILSLRRSNMRKSYLGQINQKSIEATGNKKQWYKFGQ